MNLFECNNNCKGCELEAIGNELKCRETKFNFWCKNGLTVNQLAMLCKEQIEKGNGDKFIAISNDDDGTGFHSLFTGFVDNKNKNFKTLLKYKRNKNHKSKYIVFLG